MEFNIDYSIIVIVIILIVMIIIVKIMTISNKKSNIDESIIDYMMSIMPMEDLDDLDGDLEFMTLSMLIIGDWLDIWMI